MKRFPLLFSLAGLCAFAAGACAVSAQETRYEQFRSHNSQMAALEPAWMGPLTHSDARIAQGMKFSVSNSNYPPGHPIVYGNDHGIAMIAGTRFQFDFNPPSYFRNHSSTEPDGFGNAAVQAKYRITSGNAQHGNYAVTAILYHGFGSRALENQFLSAYYIPTLAVGKGFGRFAVISTVGGVLPTSKIWDQGRAVEWNFTGEAHATAQVWFTLENNALFFHAGPLDGKKQDSLTPVAFYQVKRKEWGPQHAGLIFGCGMQNATTHYHFQNHNLITEMRVIF